MKEKKSGIAFTVLSLALCASLSLGMLAFGPAGAVGNETLAPLPVLRAEGRWNPAFLSELSAYVGDHFFPRPALLTLRARLYALLGSSAVEDVVLGQEGWLFYAPTLPDYAGTAPMSAASLDAAARNLSLMNEYCQTRGLRFLFTVAPNKNSLYPAWMPARLIPGTGPHDAQRLFQVLERQGVPYVDLFAAFAEQREVLYFSHDSHWNSKGAALAAERICAALGRDAAYFTFGAFESATLHSGDLFEMLYPGGTDGETDLVYGGVLDYQRQGNDTRPDSITIQTTGGGSGSLLAFRDSFGNLLYPYLADAFASAMFSRSPSYDLNRAVLLGMDCVLIELVERNLDWLLEYVPVMPAPVRETVAVPRRAASTAEADSLSLGPAGCVLWQGVLPEDAGSEPPAEGIYLDCGTAIYECFTLSGGVYAAWLPSEAAPVAVLY